MHQMMVPLGFAVLQLVPGFFAVFHRYSYALRINDVHNRDDSGTEQRTASAGFQRKLLAQFGACFGSCDNQHRHREGEGPICRQERPECLL